MIELFTGRPAFPGSSEADQLFRLCAVLGAPPAAGNASWREGEDLGRALGLSFSKVPARGVASTLPPGASPAAVKACAALLSWNPAIRPTAAGALSTLEFFASPSGLETPLPPLLWDARSEGELVKARGEAAVRQAALERSLGQELGRGGGAGGGKCVEDENEDGGDGKEADRGGKEEEDDDDDEGAYGGKNETPPKRPLNTTKRNTSSNISPITTTSSSSSSSSSTTTTYTTETAAAFTALSLGSQGGRPTQGGRPAPPTARGAALFSSVADSSPSPPPKDPLKCQAGEGDDLVSSSEEEEGSSGYKPSGLDMK